VTVALDQLTADILTKMYAFHDNVVCYKLLPFSALVLFDVTNGTVHGKTEQPAPAVSKDFRVGNAKEHKLV